jgi:hypothetical protein
MFVAARFNRSLLCSLLALAVLPLPHAVLAQSPPGLVAKLVEVNTGGTSNGPTCTGSFTVPRGMRFHIDFVSFSVALNNANLAGGSIQVVPPDTSGTTFELFFDIVPGVAIQNGDVLFQGGDVVDLFGDSGDLLNITLQFDRAPATAANCQFSLSGEMTQISP